MATATSALPDHLRTKLGILASKLNVDDDEAALEKSLDIANYIADVMNNREQRLLVEDDGRYTELSGWKR